MMQKFQQGWERSLAQSDGGVSFWNNMLVRILFGAAVLAIFLSLGVLGYFIKPSDAVLMVLHYNVYFGVDLLGLWWQAYILPFLGGVFLFGHLFLARRFYARTERIACYLMLLSSGMLSFGILVATVSVALINY
ncbi:MAG: hypothetical protein WA082_04170 [Candidatus Moraniibacteriota bacterium]